jgi:hypothetical protein
LIRCLAASCHFTFSHVAWQLHSTGEENEDDDEEEESRDMARNLQDKFRLEELESEAKFLMEARVEEPTPKKPTPSITPRSTKKTLAKAQHTLANFYPAEAAYADKTPKKTTSSVKSKSTTKKTTSIQHSPAALKRKNDIANMQRLNAVSIAARVASTPKAKPASSGSQARSEFYSNCNLGVICGRAYSLHTRRNINVYLGTDRKRSADSELSRPVGLRKRLDSGH